MMDNDFEIVSVEPTDPPADMAGTGWHCYVIEQGKNTIRGYQRGDIDSVTRAVEEIVESLNHRRYGRFGRGGRVHLVSTPRESKPANK